MRDAPTNSLLWPSTPTLKACIASINELDAKIGRSGPPAYGKATPEQSMWAEDEIIGWVYQFYNAEEKVAIRDRGKPTHPAEVAVINQFFTPRWIIKFLVDNTLGGCGSRCTRQFKGPNKMRLSCPRACYVWE